MTSAYKAYFLVLIASAVLTIGSASAQNYKLYSDIQYDTIPGVDANLLSLDVYQPTTYTGKRPVIVNIHGGYWYAGDKRIKRSKAELFTDSGYVFISINYRLSPNPIDTLSVNAVRFPIHPQDCAKAIAWVFKHVDSYGGDSSQISLIGHSAGAHLVLLLSTNERFLNQEGIALHRLKCTCSLDAGVFDLAEELRQAGDRIIRRAPLINAFGRDTSLYDDASPQFNIDRGEDIPWIHFVYQDTEDRVYGNTRFADSLLANGFPNVSLFNAAPYDHGTINSALGSPMDSIGETQSVMTFLTACLENRETSKADDLNIGTGNLIIYPNPSSDFIQVDCRNGFKIYDSVGRLLKQSNQKTKQISVADFNPGLYTLISGNRTARFIKNSR